MQVDTMSGTRTHAGVINWTHFELSEKKKVTVITDSSKSDVNAVNRRGDCTDYNPGVPPYTHTHARAHLSIFYDSSTARS